MMNEYDARDILFASEVIADAPTVQSCLDRLGRDIASVLHDRFPLVLPVMGGAIVFAGQLLPRLDFPLDFDYLHVTRYRGKTQGGAIEWRVLPGKSVAGRSVLVLDDILDEGETLYAIRQKLQEMGAARIYTAVLADKAIEKSKPVKADFVGLTVPNRYVFGCGMDAYGLWRNLPEIRALQEE
jgi:hypoxanthine phosphoribosyltransferase